MRPQTSRYYTFIKPILKNKYAQTYSGPIFSIITITIFTLFAIKPTVSTIVSLQKSIKEQQQTLLSLQKKAEDLTLAKENYDALSDESKQNLEFLLPNQTSLSELIQNINTIINAHQATSSGMQIEQVDLDGSPDKINRNPSIKEIDFLVNVQGSYSQLTSLLDKLSKSTRLISIKTVSFNKPPEGINLTMSITGKAYYFKN